MKTINGTVVLENIKRYSAGVDGVRYVDSSGSEIFIPIEILVRLYDGIEEHIRGVGLDWDKFCKNIFKK
jgi:hypothetical protein